MSSRTVPDKETQMANDELMVPVVAVIPLFIGRVMSLVVFVLILASTVSMYLDSEIEGYSARLFLLDKEGNVPTLYAGLSLFFCAILLAIEYWLAVKQVSPQRYYWLGLSIIFSLFAVDEMCSIHEIFIALRPVLGTSGFLYFAWVIPGALFVVVVVGIYWKFVLSLPDKTRNLFLIAGAIYVSGVLGVEMIGAYYAQYGSEHLVYLAITTVEEALEMTGIIIFSYALLNHISSQLDSLKFKFVFKES